MNDYQWVIQCPFSHKTHNWRGMKDATRQMTTPEGVTFTLIGLMCRCGAHTLIMKPDMPLSEKPLDFNSIRDGDLIQ